jgi:hypothetical protein
MSDAHPPRPDQPSWIAPSVQPVHVPRPVPDRPGRVPALMAAAFLTAGLVFVLGLPVVGGIGGSGTRITITVPSGAIVRARFPDPATGPRLSLSVDTAPDDPHCTTHTVNGEPAYQTDCATAGGSRFIRFHVTLRNESSTPVEWQLGELLLVGGNSPLATLRAAGGTIPSGGTLQPGEVASGFVDFEVSQPFVPSEIEYLDQQELVVDVSAP